MPSFASLFIQPPWWLALALAAVFAIVAYLLRWLSWGGAASTCVVGFLVFGLGGGRAVVPLLVFFLTSSLLSKIRKWRRLPDRFSAKGSTRDAGQVWANGGMAVGIVVAYPFLRLAMHWPAFQLVTLPYLFLSALATVNADTWATEIGGLIGQTPRSLRDWKPVPPGTSGGISVGGTLGALAGAIVIPLSVYRLWGLTLAHVVVVAWAGFLGSFLDSILGAHLQAQYQDPGTKEITERTEVAGRATRLVRGLSWMDNDMVNFLASAGGVACGAFLLRYAAILFR